MGSFLGLRAMHMAHEPQTARTAACRLLPRTLRSPALKRPKGRGPEERFMESFLGLGTMLTALEPQTARTAAFRLLPAPLWSSPLKRPKGHGPGDGFMGSSLGPITCSWPMYRGRWFDVPRSVLDVRCSHRQRPTMNIEY